MKCAILPQMRHRLNRLPLALLFLALFCFSSQSLERSVLCGATRPAHLHSQTAKPAQVPTVEYRVRVASLESERIDVSMQVSNVPPGSPLIIRSVPLYMDNPLAAADGPVLTGFQAFASDGHPLGLTKHEEKDTRETLFEIGQPEETVRIDYQVRMRFKESDQTNAYAIRIPCMDRKRALIYGNYLFCYPELGKDKQESVGMPIVIEVEFEPPQNTFFWGIRRRFSFHTIYQLMSLQFGLGEYEEDLLPPVGLTPLSVVFERSKDFSKKEREAVRKVVRTAFEAVCDLFGEASFEEFSTLVYRDEALGGMEGTFACQVFAPHEVDLANAKSARTRNLYSVITHEIFHTWNPIALFPSGDPWMKEGVTGYYGEVLSVRAGLQKEEDLANNFRYYATQLGRNRLIGKLRLTDPLIWQNEYLNEDWRTITYERGKAVALLLDLEIRETTENRHSLDDVMRFLYRQYNGKSYSHDELLQAVRSATGADLSGFFNDYVSGTRLPSQSEIQAAKKRLVRLGVYEHSGRTLQSPESGAGLAQLALDPALRSTIS